MNIDYYSKLISQIVTDYVLIDIVIYTIIVDR